MKKKILLLSMAGLLCFSHTVWASPFPNKTDEIVQDEDNYLNKRDRESFAQAIKKLPGEYKVVVVESTQPEAQTPDQYAQLLYDNYNLSDNALMMVLDINTQQLGVYAGPELAAKGAKPEMLHEKIINYYEPYRNQKEYMSGIELFVTEVQTELNRIATGGTATTAAAAAEAAKPEAATKKVEGKSAFSLPWWLYAIGLLFVALLVTMIYSFFRRRQIFTLVDEVEEWKEELAEKINTIEVEKSLRRATGTTEERYIMIANRKENLLRVKIPEVEMTILDAEESCDRFRFQLAIGLLDEARHMLDDIEKELSELKQDTTKVVQTKKENKLAIPEIGKIFEAVERKLTNARLEHGLSFHELKVQLDEVESMRSQVKEALADGDDIRGYETTLKAQQQLALLTASLEELPQVIVQVQKELPEELKQLEEGISSAAGDGFELSGDYLDGALLQAKQLMLAAQSALEEGNLDMVKTHVKAFELKIDATYQSIEESILGQKEAAAAQALVDREAMKADDLPAELAAMPVAEQSVQKDDRLAVEDSLSKEYGSAVENSSNMAEASARTDEGNEKAAASTIALTLTDANGKQSVFQINTAESFESDLEEETTRTSLKDEELITYDMISAKEREVLLDRPIAGEQAEQGRKSADPLQEEPFTDDDEYELVIPKLQQQDAAEEIEEHQTLLVFDTEDDALDELERISGALTRIRQQIKRSYLPGIPDHVKYLFDEIIEILARTQTTMERYKYDLEEIAILLTDAGELIEETERLTERIIADCQRAEGAIQYTNRYRRQNRKVNELLTKAEMSFRELSFNEAFQFAEEARLVIEGVKEEPEEKGWLLRKKKKGAGN